MVAGLHLGVPIGRLIAHDNSKFSDAEWWAYVAWMYDSPDGTTTYWRDHARDFRHDEEAQLRRRRFERAWRHHWVANPHHWEHWAHMLPNGLLLEPARLDDPSPMPETFVREMVADWIGAGYVQGKRDIVGWYLANADRMRLHPDTRRLVMQLMIAEVPVFRKRYP